MQLPFKDAQQHPGAAAVPPLANDVAVRSAARDLVEVGEAEGPLHRRCAHALRARRAGVISLRDARDELLLKRDQLGHEFVIVGLELALDRLGFRAELVHRLQHGLRSRRDEFVKATKLVDELGTLGPCNSIVLAVKQLHGVGGHGQQRRPVRRTTTPSGAAARGISSRLPNT